MPPKKRARTSAHVLESFPVDLAATVAPSELTSEHLLRAYGLSGPVDPDDEEDPYRICTCKWLTDEQPAPLKEAIETVEMIVLGDSEGEGEDNNAQPAPSLKRQRGKGKGKEKLSVCSKDNCQNNPRCLNWLGQDKWEETEKAFVAFKKAAKIGGDPSNDRDIDLPVGLRVRVIISFTPKKSADVASLQNLGATCYVNSFLQVWFQDETFRSGVYSCLPPANGNVETSPLFQLQVLFAFLQSANQAVYDPEPLVTALKLDKTEQQDSQEFSKLFMDLLDHEFKKQGSRAASEGVGAMDVSELVSKQFEGTKTYGTQCDFCKTKSERPETFRELEINLSVLHFSLLRFVYNAKEMARSKVHHAISYPLKLDMGSFFPPDNSGDRPEIWYDLKGVLMHKGTSAHSGHYVAQVHDERKNKWYLFDDETVSSIDNLNDPNRYDEEEETKNAKKKGSKKKTDFPRTSSGEVLPRSKDACETAFLDLKKLSSCVANPFHSDMLVYTRQETTSASTEPTPPPLALMKVEELDAKHLSELTEYQVKVAAVQADFDKARDAKRAVYRSWNASEEDDDSVVVDQTSLRHWLSAGLKPESTKKDKVECIPKQGESLEKSNKIMLEACPKTPEETPKPDEDMVVDDSDTSITPTVVCDSGSPEQVNSNLSGPSIDSSNILCKHGSVDPKKASLLKVINKAGVTALQDQGVTVEPLLRVEGDLCRDCVWGIAAGQSIPTFASLCLRGVLNMVCVLIPQDRLYEESHPEWVAKFKAAQDHTADQAVWISKRWLNGGAPSSTPIETVITDTYRIGWQKPKASFHVAYDLKDPDPSSQDWAEDVYCPHGELHPDESKRKTLNTAAYSVLKELFPEWEPLSSKEKSCNKCRRGFERETQSAGEVLAQHKKEKAVFKSFDDQPRLGSNGLLMGTSGEQYLVPSPWVVSWRKWSKKPKESPRPERLINSVLLCSHEKLILDLDVELQRRQKAVAVGAKEWELLQSNYSADPPIKIWMNGDNAQSSPMVCDGCLEDHRKKFTEASIWVKVLNSNDIDETGARKESRSPSSELEVIESPSEKKNFLNLTGTRASKRIKNQPMISAAKQKKKIAMFKDDTVKDLKMRIDDKLDIATIYQRLWYNNHEIESDHTVAALGLYDGATIELLEVSVNEDVDLSKLDDSVSDGKRKRGKRGEGFGGTGLFGWHSQNDAGEGGDLGFKDVDTVVASSVEENGGESGSFKGRPRRTAASESQEGASTAAEGRRCPHCTYIQEGGPEVEDCEVCQLPL